MRNPERRMWAAAAMMVIADMTTAIRKDPASIAQHRRYLQSRDARDLFNMAGLEWSPATAERVLEVATSGSSKLVDPRTGRKLKTRKATLDHIPPP